VTQCTYSGVPGIDSISFSSHLVIQRKYTRYLSQLLVSLVLSVDPHNCVDPHGLVVSHPHTFILRCSSIVSKKRVERLSQRHPMHRNPDASLYSMNPFRCMVTDGHTVRVFLQNRRPTEQEETANQRSENDFATRRAVLMPGAEKSATGVSLTAWTHRIYSDAAILPGRKCILLMYFQ